MQDTTGTFDHEDALPRVPLPSLEDSCERFLQWCSPLLTEHELTATQDAVAEALRPGSPERRLHAALEEREAAGQGASWLEDFWATRYLGRRDRTALNANFFFLLEAAEAAEADRVVRAAGLLAAALHVKQQIDEERLPPDLQQERPTSMKQVKHLFSATRVPGAVQDTVRTPFSADRPGPSPERHVVVLHRGHAFRLDVLGPQGRPLPLEELAAGLREVLAASASSAAPQESVGHLTTGARAEWAANRQALLEVDPGNAEVLEAVESALLCLCLEDLVPADVQQACDQLLHGDSGNRWFDKALSLIVFGDGTAGLNVEHCELDGTTVLMLVDAMLSAAPEEHSRRSGAQPQGAPVWRPLTFVLDGELRSQVRAAGAAFTAYAADTASSVVCFKGFGADHIKALRISPDAFAQLAYQLAYRRVRGRVGPTYESVATRQFRHGRTEAMRVVTPEVLRFVTAMDDGDPTSRREALRAAADAHVWRARECKHGQAPEQHLWELQLLQQRRGAELGIAEPPTLTSTPGWRVMREDELSTSSAPSEHIQFFGFGSTSPRCIGVAYVLLPQRWNLYLSALQSLSDELDAFAYELRRAVEELRDLLVEEA